jgi:hypothetical protein
VTKKGQCLCAFSLCATSLTKTKTQNKTQTKKKMEDQKPILKEN